MNMKIFNKIIGLFLFLVLLIPAQLIAKEDKGKPQVKCNMVFDLKSWAVFYKSTKGSGTITCSNGQKANVEISAGGSGVSFGKSRIEKGHGSFTKVYDISELYGRYIASEASAGASGSAQAQAMTKGHISLSLSGTGHGVDIGFTFGSFKISPVK
jgi:hypothetical protein